jgi:ferrous iron transport protein A
VQQRQLSDLEVGEQAIVTAIDSDGDPGVVRRLREIGFSEGAHVEVLHHAPFGRDPMAVNADSTTVAIRRAQASLIAVMPFAASGLAQAAE